MATHSSRFELSKIFQTDNKSVNVSTSFLIIPFSATYCFTLFNEKSAKVDGFAAAILQSLAVPIFIRRLCHKLISRERCRQHRISNDINNINFVCEIF